jgi:hypothetical protein
MKSGSGSYCAVESDNKAFQPHGRSLPLSVSPHMPDLPKLSAASADDFDLWLEAGRTEKHYWLDLWRYRELFAILAWRDVAIRYKQTVAGAAWAIVQPFFSMVIMTVIFGKVAGLPSQGTAPYALMVFAALLPWQVFRQCPFHLQSESRRQCQPHLQGLLSPPDHPHQRPSSLPALIQPGTYRIEGAVWDADRDYLCQFQVMPARTHEMHGRSSAAQFVLREPWLNIISPLA